MSKGSKTLVAVFIIAGLAIAFATGFYIGKTVSKPPIKKSETDKKGPEDFANSPYYHSIYFTVSSDPTTFPAGTLIAEHTSVPDVIQLKWDVGEYKKGDLLVYFVDFADVKEGELETIGLLVSDDSGKTWGKKQTITFKNKQNKGAVVDPSLVQLDNGKLRLYFFGSEVVAGKDPALGEDSHKVYSATSQDGKNFEVEKGLRFQDEKLTDPEVVFFNNQWFMYYSTGRESLLATSPDGLNFTKKTSQTKDIGGIPGAVVIKGKIRLYGCGKGISSGISSDGVNFTKDKDEIVPGCDPSPIILENGQYMLVYKEVKSPLGY